MDTENKKNIDKPENVDNTKNVDNIENVDNIDNTDLDISNNKNIIGPENEEDPELEEVREKMKELDDQIEQYFKKAFEEMEKEGKIKMVNGKPKLRKKVQLLKLLKPLFGFILLLSLTGFINWIKYDNIYMGVIAIASIAILDFVFDGILKSFFMLAILKSFGALNLLAPILSFTLVCVFFPSLEFPNIGLIILVMILYIVIKIFFFSSIKNIKTAREDN